MRIFGVTFSDEKMTESARVCTESMQRNGVGVVWQQNPNTIGADFRRINHNILSQPRGAGYWLWKPYFIDKAMNERQVADGDIIVYSDAGVEWIDNVHHLINSMDQDIFLFSNGHEHRHWCKGVVLNAINGYSWWKDSDQQQVQASVIIIRVNEYTRKVIREWLVWCQMPGFIDDSPSTMNHPEFAEHRHDQAILTCVAIREGIRLHWWADQLWYVSQRHRWPNDTYPPMFIHHRKRNKGMGGGVNPEWL